MSFIVRLKIAVQKIFEKIAPMYRGFVALIGIPWSVSKIAGKDLRDWSKSNPHRIRNAYSWHERELFFYGEHPVRFTLSLLALQITIIILAILLPADWLYPSWIDWTSAEHLNHFSTIWTVQATVVALVYPIIISFVAVFLQRRPGGESFIHIYMLDSGGLAAGLSSITLVFVMGVQYLLIPTWGSVWLPAWATLGTLWFLLNAAMTAYFLYKTVVFLMPRNQSRVIMRYLVNISLPRDAKALYIQSLFLNGKNAGWFSESKSHDAPKIILGGIPFGDEEVQLTKRIKVKSEITNAKIWAIKFAIFSWQKIALAKSNSNSSRNPNSIRDHPTLRISAVPGSVVEDDIPLIAVSDGPPLNWYQKLFFFAAFDFNPVSKLSIGVSVKEVLEELSYDTQVAASRGERFNFERSYIELIALHKTILQSCIDWDKDGNPSSWALLRNYRGFSNPTLHGNWLEVYRPIIEAAVQGMSTNTVAIRNLCHLYQHFGSKEFESSPYEFWRSIIIQPTILMHNMQIWWEARIGEQMDKDVGMHSPMVLRSPLAEVYEEAIESFVGGWEGARRNQIYRHSRKSDFNWKSGVEITNLHALHVEETAAMLVLAVRRGDEVSAEWLADILNKWGAGFDSGTYAYQVWGRRHSITLDHTQMEWGNVVDMLKLKQFDEGIFEKLSSSLQEAVHAAALKNFWQDIRWVTIEILVSYCRAPIGSLPESSLALKILLGLLEGKHWKAGGHDYSQSSRKSSNEYLMAKVRQFGKTNSAYTSRLDQFVSRLKRAELPRMVSSRVYSGWSHDDLASLQESQVVILATLATENWKFPENFYTQVESWMRDGQFSIERLLNQLTSWFDSSKQVRFSMSAVTAALQERRLISLEKPADLGRISSAIQTAIATINERASSTLLAESIDLARILEISKYASGSAFSRSHGNFPVHLFDILHSNSELNSFHFSIQDVNKSELVISGASQRAINESEYYEEIMASIVASVALDDVLKSCNSTTINAPAAKSYWETVKTESLKIHEKGFQPILILGNPTQPEWVFDWQYSDLDVDSRPGDLMVHQKPAMGGGYLCNFNNIEVYSAQIQSAESILIAKEVFSKISFTEFQPDCFVKITPIEKPEPKLYDLKMEFFRSVSVKSAAASYVRIKY